MRFEKLNENKIRITLSNEDLIQKDIDFHTFMSNSIESQDLFFDMLEEAEKEIGFVTKDYLIRIEALAMAGGNFVLTVTRSLPDTSTKSAKKKKVHIKRKSVNSNATKILYCFSDFEAYCSFLDFFNNNDFSYSNLASSITLYEYNDLYYLLLNGINLSYPNLKRLLLSVTEFGTFVSSSEAFCGKLLECGKLIAKHNAIKTSLKYFVK